MPVTATFFSNHQTFEPAKKKTNKQLFVPHIKGFSLLSPSHVPCYGSLHPTTFIKQSNVISKFLIFIFQTTFFRPKFATITIHLFSRAFIPK